MPDLPADAVEAATEAWLDYENALMRFEPDRRENYRSVGRKRVLAILRGLSDAGYEVVRRGERGRLEFAVFEAAQVIENLHENGVEQGNGYYPESGGWRNGFDILDELRDLDELALSRQQQP